MSYVKDSDNRWHRIYDQSKGSSCGPTCMRMVVQMITGKEIGEAQARRMVEMSEGGVLSTITSEGGGMGQMGSHDWGNHGGHASGGGGVGCTGTNLVNGLKRAGISTARAPQLYARQALLQTSVRKPGIAMVGWNGGWGGKSAQGAHWIVVAGQLRNGNVLVLDPIFGLSEVDLSPSTLVYTPAGHRATFYNNQTIITS